MSRDECLRLLGSHGFGRLAVADERGAYIFPVNYVLDGEDIAIRSDAGTKVRLAPLRRVAFEVDHVDSESGEGWSVVAEGLAHLVTEAIDVASEQTKLLPLTPWASGPKTEWLKIVGPDLSGRRLRQSSEGAER